MIRTNQAFFYINDILGVGRNERAAGLVPVFGIGRKPGAFSVVALVLALNAFFPLPPLAIDCVKLKC